MEIHILKDKVEESWALKLEADELAAQQKALGKRRDELQQEIINILELAGIDKFSSESCTASVRTKSSVKVPKEPESRDEFFAYLKEQGIFEDMITVHSQTLNGWYNREKEFRGDDFKVPGLEEPTPYQRVELRKR